MSILSKKDEYLTQECENHPVLPDQKTRWLKGFPPCKNGTFLNQEYFLEHFRVVSDNLTADQLFLGESLALSDDSGEKPGF